MTVFITPDYDIPPGAIHSSAQELDSGYYWCDHCRKYVSILTIAHGHNRWKVCNACWWAALIKGAKKVLAAKEIAPARKCIVTFGPDMLPEGVRDKHNATCNFAMEHEEDCSKPGTHLCKVCGAWYCRAHYNEWINKCSLCIEKAEEDDMEGEDFMENDSGLAYTELAVGMKMGRMSGS